MRAMRPHVGTKTVAWVAWPKGAAAAGRDVSRDTIWRFGATNGLGPVSNISIDERSSALRVRPTG